MFEDPLPEVKMNNPPKNLGPAEPPVIALMKEALPNGHQTEAA